VIRQGGYLTRVGRDIPENADRAMRPAPPVRRDADPRLLPDRSAASVKKPDDGLKRG
jgi:hypothetical protein